MGKCRECGDDYQSLIDKVSEEAIIRSVEDSQRKGAREVEATIEWGDKDDMVKKLLKKVINSGITVDEFKMLSKEVEERM